MGSGLPIHLTSCSKDEMVLLEVQKAEWLLKKFFRTLWDFFRTLWDFLVLRLISVGGAGVLRMLEQTKAQSLFLKFFHGKICVS